MFDARAYLAIVSSLIDYLRGKNPDHSICYVVFNLGKRSARFSVLLDFFISIYDGRQQRSSFPLTRFEKFCEMSFLVC